jgi:predicted RNA-binding protein YlqC (UPF0109 family)
MSQNDSIYADFCELAEDTIKALVADPDAVSLCFHRENDTISVELSGSRAMIAMFVGKGGDTARAVQRVLYCQARNAGLASRVFLTWEPTDQAD